MEIPIELFFTKERIKKLIRIFKKFSSRSEKKANEKSLLFDVKVIVGN